MASWQNTLMGEFNEALNRGDVDAMMSMMTDDCLFEDTYPSPFGTRYEGQAAVRGYWERFFAAVSRAQIEQEELFACGDHGVQRWEYHWTDRQGSSGSVRGVDVFRFRGGKIAEKRSYVKG
jgi:ketosteroid isomerase-like protein